MVDATEEVAAAVVVDLEKKGKSRRESVVNGQFLGNEYYSWSSSCLVQR